MEIFTKEEAAVLQKAYEILNEKDYWTITQWKDIAGEGDLEIYSAGKVSATIGRAKDAIFELMNESAHTGDDANAAVFLVAVIGEPESLT